MNTRSQQRGWRWLVVVAMLAVAPMASAQGAPEIAREQLNALLWQQRSVEYQANALQVYRQAGARLAAAKSQALTASIEQMAAGGFAKKPPAIVLDVDETVLDNSAYNARLVFEGRQFEESTWSEWVQSAQAIAVPGAREFLSKARQAKFRIVFITNRRCDAKGGYDLQGKAQICPQRKPTLDNLESALGFRPADGDLLMRDDRRGRDDSNKVERRLEVAQTHRIAMLLGDDLHDFVHRDHYDAVAHGPFWGAVEGAAWFVLPNPIYGSWERGYRDLAAKYQALRPWQAPAMVTPLQAAETAPVAAKTLRVVSWNLEWLADADRLDATGFWQRCRKENWPSRSLIKGLPICEALRATKTSANYRSKKIESLKASFKELALRGVDVIAFQEVGSRSALMQVLGPDYAIVCISNRGDPQEVGYAMRHEAAPHFAGCVPVDSLAVGNVRPGMELQLKGLGTASSNLVLLNLHLKASCSRGPMNPALNANCNTLQRQMPHLEAWIERQAEEQRAFVVLGDWNRDLEAEIRAGQPARVGGSDAKRPNTDPAKVRFMWPEINDFEPLTSAMETARVQRDAAKQTGCLANLDHLALSLTAKNLLRPQSLSASRVPAALLSLPKSGSDHCPLEALFTFN